MRKMTKEDKVKAYEMLLNGATYRECAERFGVSLQYIHKAIPISNSGNSKRWAKCIYPALAEFFCEKGYSYTKVAELCGIRVQRIRSWLIGGFEIPKRGIDKILSITGMTYEEAFGRPERLE